MSTRIVSKRSWPDNQAHLPVLRKESIEKAQVRVAKEYLTAVVRQPTGSSLASSGSPHQSLSVSWG
jgi:hypothetical protein